MSSFPSLKKIPQKKNREDFVLLKSCKTQSLSRAYAHGPSTLSQSLSAESRICKTSKTNISKRSTYTHTSRLRVSCYIDVYSHIPAESMYIYKLRNARADSMTHPSEQHPPHSKPYPIFLSISIPDKGNSTIGGVRTKILRLTHSVSIRGALQRRHSSCPFGGSLVSGSLECRLWTLLIFIFLVEEGHKEVSGREEKT